MIRVGALRFHLTLDVPLRWWEPLRRSKIEVLMHNVLLYGALYAYTERLVFCTHVLLQWRELYWRETLELPTIQVFCHQ